jgi:hypothetical protein
LRFRGVNLLVPVGAKLILINPKKRIEQNGALFVVDRVSIAFSVNTEVWMEKEHAKRKNRPENRHSREKGKRLFGVCWKQIKISTSFYYRIIVMLSGAASQM